MAAPQPRPTLDIARLDPTTSLHSNGGGGGNGNGNGGGNGNGSNGGSVHGGHALGRNGNGNGNNDTARSGPAGAAGGSGLWGGTGTGGGSGGADNEGCRLPPVSEAAVLATNAAVGMPVQQAQLQSGDAHPARQPVADAAGAPSLAGGKTPPGVRADRQQHSGSGGSSNSPDEGHERRATGV